ncbi:hypothetical protein BVRB_041970, partial [Beta vulgaris subsp. vulgaris]
RERDAGEHDRGEAIADVVPSSAMLGGSESHSGRDCDADGDAVCNDHGFSMADDTASTVSRTGSCSKLIDRCCSGIGGHTSSGRTGTVAAVVALDEPEVDDDDVSAAGIGKPSTDLGSFRIQGSFRACRTVRRRRGSGQSSLRIMLLASSEM